MSNIDIVRGYLDKPRYADMPSLSLAKIILARHPGKWIGLEAVRMAVRRARGQNGKGRPIGEATHKRAAGSAFDGVEAGFPVQSWEEMKHYELRARKVLVISDLHVPYHHKAVIDVAVRDGISFGVNGLVVLGDYWDFHRASGSFDPERGASTLAEEIQEGKKGLEYLRRTFKRSELVFLRGNHDMRMDRFIYKRAEELWGIEECTFESITNLKGYGFELVEENAKVMAGKLPLLHGHEIIRGKGTVNAARTFFLQAKISGMIGHCHQTSQHSETDLQERLISCWSLGCLSTLHPKWGPYQPKWNHGFALIELDKEGNFQVFNKRVYKGKAW